MFLPLHFRQTFSTILDRIRSASGTASFAAARTCSVSASRSIASASCCFVSGHDFSRVAKHSKKNGLQPLDASSAPENAWFRSKNFVHSLLSLVVFALTTASAANAQLPAFYKTVNSVTWLVQDIDKVKPGWVALGMSEIHEYPDVAMTGQYHGKPIQLWAWELTGHLGNLTVHMVQPAEGQLNAWNDFLGKHGDGVFSIMHEVKSQEEMNREIQRLSGLGVGILQQLRFQRDGKQIIWTYFDTEPKGKYVLGLVYWQGGAPALGSPGVINHLGPVVKDLESVSAYWEKLGFPAFRMEHATPRPDSTYRGNPLSLSFDVGYQNHDQFSYEWIAAPSQPPNIYADFLKLHTEGIQHLGMPVDDLGQAVSRFDKLGYHVWQSGAWGDVGKKDSGQYDYMDTNKIGGVSIELIHAYK